MKKLIFISLIWFSSISLFSQDGSNIRYLKPEYLNKSFIGKSVHIDFGLRSFGGHSIDTITIIVEGKPIQFIEHREDNGYENWFERQYLIALPREDWTEVRLSHSTIDSISAEKIHLTSLLSYYHLENPLDTITIFNHSYLRKNIAEILIRD
ncbi:MAG: hypothetical protein AAGC85_21715 [Bacteroidota bacterium]